MFASSSKPIYYTTLFFCGKDYGGGTGTSSTQRELIAFDWHISGILDRKKIDFTCNVVD
jgi:hypothetical protein